MYNLVIQLHPKPGNDIFPCMRASPLTMMISDSSFDPPSLFSPSPDGHPGDLLLPPPPESVSVLKPCSFSLLPGDRSDPWRGQTLPGDSTATEAVHGSSITFRPAGQPSSHLASQPASQPTCPPRSRNTLCLIPALPASSTAHSLRFLLPSLLISCLFRAHLSQGGVGTGEDLTPRCNRGDTKYTFASRRES